MKKKLYLGIDPPQDDEIHHCPIIKIFPRPLHEYESLLKESYTHFIFTSKNAVRIVSQSLENKPCLVVGSQTAGLLESKNFTSVSVASNETAEGLIELIEAMNLEFPYFFWPHSSLSRPLIRDYLLMKNYHFQECVVYDTKTVIPKNLPNLKNYDKIIFTSPSTVIAFIEIFGKLPPLDSIETIGPITKQKILNALNLSCFSLVN